MDNWLLTREETKQARKLGIAQNQAQLAKALPAREEIEKLQEELAELSKKLDDREIDLIQAKKDGFEAGKALGRKEGAVNERERIHTWFEEEFKHHKLTPYSKLASALELVFNHLYQHKEFALKEETNDRTNIHEWGSPKGLPKGWRGKVLKGDDNATK